MAWLWLAIAAAFEVGWAIGLKRAADAPGVAIWAATAAAMLASIVFLALAVRDLPIGTAYAVWTGTGAAGVFIAGILLFGEPADVPRLASVGLIVAGVAGLKLLSP
jgi:quaternary ammonium compound-resistance protein SugE